MFPSAPPAALPTPPLPPAAYEQLLAYLRASASPLTPLEAMDKAIKLWIAQSRADAAPTRGYQWKQLFLPDGTRLRMHANDNWYSAEISGDDLIYQGEAMSPHQMAQHVAGDGRNAWRLFSIRFPGEKNWTSAHIRRARLSMQAAKATTTPRTPADAMAAAAKAMSDALSTALTLVEHVDHQSRNTLERRLPRYRRQLDQMEDIH